MLDRPVLVVHVQARPVSSADGIPEWPGEQLADPGYAAVEPVDLGVDLDPVTGRDDEGLSESGSRATSDSSLPRVSSLAAARSRVETGALLWLRPTTRTLTRVPALAPLLGGASQSLGIPPLRVEGEDLQLDRQVDLTHVYAFGHVQHQGGEIEDAGHADRDKPVAHGLGCTGGIAITPMATGCW